MTAEQIAGQAAQEWRADERNKTLQEMLLLLAQARFGADLPAELPERLGRYSLAQLTNLATSLATVANLADWLATLPDITNL